MTTHVYKSGTNRGNRRIWIEGQRLVALGVSRGLKFRREMNADTMDLIIGGEGQHTVAGTPERPIIDLNGKYLNEFFGDAGRFAATFHAAENNQPPRISIVTV